MYFGAEHLIGFFTVVPSAQWYSYLGGERSERGRGEVIEEGWGVLTRVPFFAVQRYQLTHTLTAHDYRNVNRRHETSSTSEH